MNILLAVDGSPYTKKMLAYLAAHDEMLGTSHSYTAITVQAALPPRARAALGKETVDSYYAEEGEKVLAPVVKFLARHGVQLKTVTKVGPAGETIAKVAESGKYDLIVMGTHGHGSLGKLVMGSVSTQVLANCQVPVLLVR
ncbi:MAG: universal stress protein [Alicycliphilus sp.]|jgi:nucleotide-binding universal stress UspA family protein|uniref:Universal stress protein n=1 Tax=Diaphorobacter limosus TaxID=3036128 RepID=A0ABZ0IZ77_9BURK|nr:universal stress protein [Diaphorobacter sp. Y-1]MBP6753928.1 universal stress protein [Alicycliphilus sp.]MBP7327033.1 universal stress protein [Alicycliphilus sp.]MBP8779532.1 universal stress protein [Alicycliphilus sp.]TXJ04156.1 MAG: universal stress protein [Alicycliphilus sp.]WOO31231.1 universal stress protein [Diaphorobacter sp. Y-1]